MGGWGGDVSGQQAGEAAATRPTGYGVASPALVPLHWRCPRPPFPPASPAPAAGQAGLCGGRHRPRRCWALEQTSSARHCVASGHGKRIRSPTLGQAAPKLPLLPPSASFFPFARTAAYAALQASTHAGIPARRTRPLPAVRRGSRQPAAATHDVDRQTPRTVPPPPRALQPALAVACADFPLPPTFPCSGTHAPSEGWWTADSGQRAGDLHPKGRTTRGFNVTTHTCDYLASLWFPSDVAGCISVRFQFRSPRGLLGG